MLLFGDFIVPRVALCCRRLCLLEDCFKHGERVRRSIAVALFEILVHPADGSRCASRRLF